MQEIFATNARINTNEYLNKPYLWTFVYSWHILLYSQKIVETWFIFY